MRAVRESLGMDLAFLARIHDGVWALDTTEGDVAPFGMRAGTRLPLAETACGAMLRGDLPALVPDVRAHPAGAALPAISATGVRAYLGVPLRSATGEVCGTFCVVSRQAASGIDAGDVRFMEALAGPMGTAFQRPVDPEHVARVAATSLAVDALLAALEARDGYTAAHTGVVTRLALEVAARLGLGHRELATVGESARLHDIGKLGIGDHLLRKPGPLTPAEWREMHRHPEIGERIVAALEPLAHLAPVVRAEHERWDGGGYPDGLRGEAIPLASRIVFA